jgi:hypothetical protein
MAYGKKLAKYFRKWMNHATWQLGDKAGILEK